MNSKERARLRKEGQSVAVTLEVGKAGLSDTVAKELKKQLETHRLVKVMVRKSASYEEDVRSVAEALAERSGAALVEVRGKTAVYTRGKGGSRVRDDPDGARDQS